MATLPPDFPFVADCPSCGQTITGYDRRDGRIIEEDVATFSPCGCEVRGGWSVTLRRKVPHE